MFTRTLFCVRVGRNDNPRATLRVWILTAPLSRFYVGSPVAVALLERSSRSAALDQPGELLKRITAYLLEESQHHRLVRSVKVPIAKAP